MVALNAFQVVRIKVAVQLSSQLDCRYSVL
jgi:hypothetical protein